MPAIRRCGRHVNAGMFHNGLISSLLINVWVCRFKTLPISLDISNSITLSPAKAELAIIV